MRRVQALPPPEDGAPDTQLWVNPNETLLPFEENVAVLEAALADAQPAGADAQPLRGEALLQRLVSAMVRPAALRSLAAAVKPSMKK